MLQLWNDRYSQSEFAFGVLPNVYFAEKIKDLKAGKILLPAEGEGRNAVYAAKLGWDAACFDQSESGKVKALNFAASQGVQIQYTVSDANAIKYPPQYFDAIALIYAHFSADLKSTCHKTLVQSLKKGGVVIFEAFSKNHPAYQEKYPNIGGPKNVDVLFSTEEIKNDFSDFDIIELTETEVSLDEGIYHQGFGSVIRFFGIKK
jgi:hypothetical protein